MKSFNLDKKTGFKVVTSPVIINDYRGVLFYDTSQLENKVNAFNLPEGNYFLVRGKIEKLDSPIAYRFPVLPKPQRLFPNPFSFKIVFGYNPNKATIFWGKKTILFDTNLRSYSLPELFFILYHEHGHKMYKTEKFADLYAAKMMVKEGFPLSLSVRSQITSLSDNQYERKKFLLDKIYGIKL